MTQCKGQTGLSMIELLIALAISSFLILGVTQIYIDNKGNYLFQQGQSENVENGRYALMVLEQQLAKTGYRRRPADSFEFAFPPATAGGCSFSEGDTMVRVDAATLCLRYQPRDDNERDCAGNTVPFSGIGTPYNSFNEFIVEQIAVGGNDLVCNGAVLVSGVADVRFDFGVGPAGEREVSGYTDTPGTPIRSLRYTLLLASQRGNLQGMTSQVYCDWHGTSPPCNAPADNKLYHIASSSMTLRNLMP